MRIVVFLGVLAALSSSPATGQSVDPDAPVSSDVRAGQSPAAPAGAAQGLPERATPPRTLRAHWHVYIAFAVAWLLLFGYALSVGRRFGRLEDEVRRLGGGAG